MTAVQFARRCVALLLVALACSTLAVRPAFAQSMTGSLTGTIVDQTGAIVVGADVTLINEASRDVRRTKSNSDGYFASPPSPQAPIPSPSRRRASRSTSRRAWA